MEKIDNNSFTLLALVAIVAVTGIVGLLLMSSTGLTSNANNNNLAGEAMHLKPQHIEAQSFKSVCCQGSNNNFYEIPAYNAQQVCKDRYEGHVVDSRFCNEPLPRDVCCFLESNNTVVWLTSATCDDLGGEIVSGIETQRKCNAQNAGDLVNDSENMVCCQQSDSEITYGYGSWVSADICEQAPGASSSSLSEEDCGRICMKFNSTIDWVSLSQWQTIDGDVVSPNFCE